MYNSTLGVVFSNLKISLCRHKPIKNWNKVDHSFNKTNDILRILFKNIAGQIMKNEYGFEIP